MSEPTSVLTTSLRRAVELAEAYPDHDVTLVVLSDFELFDPNPAQAIADMAAFPGQVHAIALGGHLAAGLSDTSVTVTKVSRDSPPGAVARALFRCLVTHRRRSRVADE